MKGVLLVHFSSSTEWDEVGTTDDSDISLVSDSFIAFANSLLFNVEI